MLKSSIITYYAVHKGYKPGVYLKWIDCKKNVDNYKNPIFKKFNNKQEAENFVINGWKSINTNNTSHILNNTSLNTEIVSTKQVLNNIEEIKIFNPDIIVFTDGSCINNGSSNSKAGYGIYFGKNDKRNVSDRVIGKQSNNTGELTAIYKVSEILSNEIKNKNRILLVSDSIYSIRCATSYGEKNAKNKWSKDIPNYDLVKLIYETYFDKKDYIKFYHVYSHTNNNDFFSKGNDEADRLANNSLK